MTGFGRISPNGKTQYRHYQCATHSTKRYAFRCDGVLVGFDALEDTVWKWVRKLLTSPEQLQTAIEKSEHERKKNVKPQMRAIESAQKCLEGLQVKKSRLVEVYASGLLTFDEIAGEKGKLDKQIDGLSKTIADLQAEVIVSAPSYRIFTRLGMQVTLHGDGRRHWCDVKCEISESFDKPIYNKTDVLSHCKSESWAFVPNPISNQNY